MRKLVLLFCAAVLVLMAAGCSGGSGSAQTSADSAASESAGTWPENKFTDGLPVPQAGDVEDSWVSDDAGGAYCAVKLANVSVADSKAYTDALLAAGFAKVEDASGIPNSAITASGVLYSDGAKYVSMSYTNGNLVLCISLVAG
jgi:hypothetical protein